MTVVFTPAARRHARPIAAILEDWNEEADWMPNRPDPRRFRVQACLLLDRTEVTLARHRHRHRPVGFIALRHGIIHSLYLAPPARGQGIGRRLLDLAKARHRRLDLWTHQANTGARNFYAQQGFYENRLTNGEANDEKLPDVHLVWARGMA